MSSKQIYYSEKYEDDHFEYRHVVLPKDMISLLPKNKLMTEREWRSIGVQQSPGWIHYMLHSPENICQGTLCKRVILCKRYYGERYSCTKSTGFMEGYQIMTPTQNRHKLHVEEPHILLFKRPLVKKPEVSTDVSSKNTAEANKISSGITKNAVAAKAGKTGSDKSKQ